MKKHGWMVFLVIVVAVLLLLYSVAYILDVNQVAIVKTFGAAGAPIDGATQAGCHWKLPWPIQTLVRYDARQFLFDDAFEQVTTSDMQNVVVTVFCSWRIAEPGKFLPKIGSVDAAESRLRDMVRAVKKFVIAKHPLEHLVNVEPQRMKLAEIEEEMLQAIRAQAGDAYGIQVVMLGIKAQALPKTVTETVIANIREGRNRQAESYRSAGRAVADAIRSRADAARQTILAFAERKAQSIRAEGDRAAAEFYPQFKGNEQFAMFLRELEFLKAALKENSVFLLDPSLQHSLGFFKDGPALPPATPLGPVPPTTRPATTPPAP